MIRSLFVLFLITQTNLGATALEEHIIESKILGYKVRYWVHQPKGVQSELPVLFVTDGKWYMESGKLAAVSETLVGDNKVNPHIIVFVDAFDPDNPSRNRRNSQFLCNPDYVSFYKQELIPKIESTYPVQRNRSSRAILGLSFGGLNSMYFALNAHDAFMKFGIQSPAPHPCPDIFNQFENAEKLPIDIFLSTGTVNDKARDTRRLKRILEKKHYEFEYLEVPEGHNWRNWQPMLDDILIYFYGR